MNRAEDLTLKLIAETITPTESAELDHLLAADPEALHACAALLDLEAALLGEHGRLDVAPAVLRQIERLHGDRVARGVMSELAVRPAPWQRSLRRRVGRFAALGGVAVVLLLAWSAGWFVPPAGQPEPVLVARVVEMGGELNIVTAAGQSRASRVGERVAVGESLRTGGGDSFVVLEDQDAFRLELTADTLVQYLEPVPGHLQKVRLGAGIFRASVPDGFVGQSVVAVGEVEIHTGAGARFVVASTIPGVTRIEVEAGQVAVHHPAAAPLPLPAGQFALFTAPEEAPRVGRSPITLSRPSREYPVKAARVLTWLDAGDRLLAASLRQVDVWNAAGQRRRHEVPDRIGSATTGDLSGDGQTLAICGNRDGVVVLWDVARQRERRRIETGSLGVHPLTLAADGQWLALVDPAPPRQDRVRRWDTGTGGELPALATEGRAVRCLATSVDGRLLAAGLSGVKGPLQPIAIWDTATWQAAAGFAGHPQPTRVLKFSPDGRWLASSAQDGAIQLWDVGSRALIRTIRDHARPVESIAFSPDSARVAAGTRDGQVWLWDVATGAALGVLQVGRNNVWALAFTADGRHLATCGSYLPIMVWDLGQLEQPASLPPTLAAHRRMPCEP